MEKTDENSVQPGRALNAKGNATAMDHVNLAAQTAATNVERRAFRDIMNVVEGLPAHRRAKGKRGSQDNVAANIEGGVIGHRPITRKFAASIGRNATSNPLVPTAGGIVTGMEEDMTWSYSNEIDMEETEEEEQQQVIDIDSADLNNPLAVVTYVEEIYDFYRRSELSGCVVANYMANQPDINGRMRAILIDWLIEVHYKLDLLDETLFLTVNIIDRFLSKQSVMRKRLQLLGITSMLLACKYEEISVPVVEDMVLICDGAYTKKEVLDMERSILNTLEYNLSVPTPYVFMTRFLKAAQSESNKKMEMLTHYIIELCLVDYEMLKFRPSMLAASAVYTAQCSLTGVKSWSGCCKHHTMYSEEQLQECVRAMVELHRQAGQGKLTGVFRKYSADKYGCTAKAQLATVLLDHDDNA